jgi:hypothetical protein
MKQHFQMQFTECLQTDEVLGFTSWFQNVSAVKSHWLTVCSSIHFLSKYFLDVCEDGYVSMPLVKFNFSKPLLVVFQRFLANSWREYDMYVFWKNFQTVLGWLMRLMYKCCSSKTIITLSSFSFLIRCFQHSPKMYMPKLLLHAVSYCFFGFPVVISPVLASELQDFNTWLFIVIVLPRIGSLYYIVE